MDINAFPDVYSMQNIEHHFKVFAGPGAGKTKWLIDHLERVLKESKRLGKTRKIACITYTNVAADEIKRRLNSDLYRIDVSTIHSFLYRNLIKPFYFLIENDLDGNLLVNTNDMTGHLEHIPRWDRVSSWISEIEKLNSKRYGYLNNPENKKKIYKFFPTMDWFLSDDRCELKFRKIYDLIIPMRNGELLLYKKSYWRYGILHHEDVLYFSNYIISNYPETLDFIRTRFPYIFIDEFQDTTQLQTWIIKRIAEKETIVGVIGDLAQSIYMFTGAQRSDFETFHLPNIQEYKKEDNFRSSREIISYLNTLRSDIQQKEVEETVNVHPVTLLIGDVNSAREWIKENCYIEPIILTRSNNTANELRHHLDKEETKYDLIKNLYASDSSGKKRPAFIHSLLLARDYLIKGDNKSSIKEISKYLKKNNNEEIVCSLTVRELSVKILDIVLTDDFLNKTILKAYIFIVQLVGEHNIKIAANYRNGRAKDFSEEHTLTDLIPYIRTETNKNEMIRTIHSAKGVEFDSILLVLDEERKFQKWIVDCNNQIENEKEDEARIYYVGMSRAKKTLFINIPELIDDSKLYKGLNVVHL